MARGHIRARGTSLQVIVYAGDGRYTSKTVPNQGSKTSTRKAADRLLRQMLEDVDDGRHAGPDTTVAQLVKRWRRHAEPDWSPATVAAYDSYLRTHIIPALGDTKVRDVRAVDLDDFYASLRAKGLKPGSIGKVHVILRRAFAEAVRWRIIGHNPVADARPPRIAKPDLNAPEADQVRALLDHAAERDPDFWAYLVVAADTGARRGELCALRWNKVDLDRGELVIDRAVVLAPGGTVEKDTKTHQARRLALGAPAVAALREHRRRMLERAMATGVRLPADAYVFSSHDAGVEPWRPDGATQRFAYLRKRAGLPNVRLHDLRHALITDWLAAGVDPRTVMGRVGHASLQTLTRYAHHVPAKDREAAERLGGRHAKERA